MEQKTLRTIMWEAAGKTGLALGLVSTSEMFLNQSLADIQMPTYLLLALGTTLWTAKLGLCIWLMMKDMKKFAASNPKVGNDMTFKFGLISAFLSAIIFSAAVFANVTYISGAEIQEQINQLMQEMRPIMDSNTINQMDSMSQNLAEISFFSNLIYCTVYGGILSFILSRNIPKRNPFANYTPEEK